LLGLTVLFGFEFVDYEFGRRDDLLKSYSQSKDLITALKKLSIDH